MADLARRLATLGTRIEGEAARRVAVPTGISRRVRQRQAATLGIALAVLVAVAGASIVGVRELTAGSRERVGRAPIGRVIELPGGVKADEGTPVGSAPLDVGPHQNPDWAPITVPTFLGGRQAFDAVWRLYAWEAPGGVVGWYAIETTSGDALPSGGTLYEYGSGLRGCRLVPWVRALEPDEGPEPQDVLVFGYISHDVASVEVSFGGQRVAPTIFRAPSWSPFDMYAIAVSGVSIADHDDIARATTILDSNGNEVAPGPPSCLGVGQ
jgi:hypothetical protein